MADDVHLVTLGLGPEIFAVPVSCVIEILAMRELVRMPDAPAYLAGLTDVREQAVPVIDLRTKLGMKPAEVTHQTRIIVLEVPAEDRPLVVGLIADRVIEVITLSAGQIGPPPRIAAGSTGAAGGHGTSVAGRAGYIGGIGRHGGGFVIIFDMARLFSGAEVALLTADDAPAPDVRAA
jgi:purine-binding chemotaxis protein CheW